MGQTAQVANKKRIPNAERRRISTESVLDSALQLFVTRGYESTSMDDVARAAGLTKGSVYFYFKDKLTLASEVLKRSEAELFDPIFTKMRESEGTATDRIVMLTNWFARIGAERVELPLLHVLMSLEFHGRGNAVEQQVLDIYGRLHHELAELVSAGQQSGEFAPDIAAADQADVLVAVIDGMLLEWHRRKETLNGKTLARSARTLILNGIVNHTADYMSNKIVINNYGDFRKLEGQEILRSDPVESTKEGYSAILPRDQ